MTSTEPVPDPLIQFIASADRALTNVADDRLNRTSFVEALATQLAYAATTDGLVSAVTGPWGSGKSSILNMIAAQLRGIENLIVLQFNPWLFSGSEQLAGRFLDELGAQLADSHNDRATAIGELLRRYSRYLRPARLIPAVGPYLEGLGKLGEFAGEALAPDEPASLRAQYLSLVDALANSQLRLVVMIDDIDRLQDQEIREVMRLVRVLGDFPHVAYLLAFDARRVVRVLSSTAEVDGHKYLEKIVQLSYPVPEIRRADLDKLVQEDVRRLLAASHLDYEGARLDEVVKQSSRPCAHTVRDVRRYTNALPFTLSLLGREIALPDLLAMEALRLFVPSFFEQLPFRDILTANSRTLTARREPGSEFSPEVTKQQLVGLAPAGEGETIPPRCLSWCFLRRMRGSLGQNCPKITTREC